jgi:hypothetical protein
VTGIPGLNVVQAIREDDRLRRLKPRLRRSH